MSPELPNLLLLAADKPAEVISLVRSEPSSASVQDASGYSLVHAAASYNHLDLLRVLVKECKVNVDLRDEDGETALFVAETIECAKILVEELKASIIIKGIEGQTPREKIAAEGDFTEVAVYLRMKELEAGIISKDSPPVEVPPPVPEGVQINIGSLVPEIELGEVVDQDIKRKIEELAARDDYKSESAQSALRELVKEIIHGNESEEDRATRRRLN